MCNPFATAARAVLDAVDTLASVEMTYRRGSLEIRLSAVRGSTLATVADTDGLALRVRKGDWLLDACQLDLGEGPVTPRAGDFLVEADGTRWRVESPMKGTPPWAWSDRERTRFRVHVTEVSKDG